MTSVIYKITMKFNVDTGAFNLFVVTKHVVFKNIYHFA